MDARQISAAVLDAFTMVEPPSFSAVTVGDDYRLNHAKGHAGLRVEHALAALKNADTVQCFTGDKSSHILATKRIGTVGTPFTALLELAVRDGGSHMTGAWRFYDGDADASPLDVFARLVERFGITVSIGGLVEDNFVARLTVPSFSGDPTQLFGFGSGAHVGNVRVSCSMQMESGDVFIEWAYGLDQGAYQQHVAHTRNLT